MYPDAKIKIGYDQNAPKKTHIDPEYQVSSRNSYISLMLYSARAIRIGLASTLIMCQAVAQSSSDDILRLRCHLVPRNDQTAIQQQLLENGAKEDEDFEINYTKLTAHTISGLFDKPVPIEVTASQISFAAQDGVGNVEYVYIDRVAKRIDTVARGGTAGETKWQGTCEKFTPAF
jgi:hypothetical protein